MTVMKGENCPVPRGKTWYGSRTITDATLEQQLEGGIYVWNDETYEGSSISASVPPGRKQFRSYGPVYTMLVRNASGITLLPKRLVVFESDGGGNDRGRVTGYASTTAQRCFPVDEFLPAAGVQSNDLFHIVVGGSAMVLTPLANMAADIATGDWVVSLTAATSGATSAGRVHVADFTGATALLANQIINRIGIALSARTTTGTNSDLLVNVTHWW